MTALGDFRPGRCSRHAVTFGGQVYGSIPAPRPSRSRQRRARAAAGAQAAMRV